MLAEIEIEKRIEGALVPIAHVCGDCHHAGTAPTTWDVPTRCRYCGGSRVEVAPPAPPPWRAVRRTIE